MKSARSNSTRSFFSRALTDRQNSTRRSILATAAVALAAAALLVAPNLYGVTTNNTPPENPPLPVQTLILQHRDSVTLQRTFTGELHPRRTSELSFERPGRVEQIMVDDADRVTAGTVIARLSAESLRTQHDQLSAQRDAAHARLEEMLAGPRIERIAAAHASVNEQAANLEFWLREVERLGDLVEKQAANKKEFADARTQRHIAAARLENARQVLRELETGTRAEQIQAQRAEVARLTAAVREIQVELDKCLLRAPYDGAVALRMIDEGYVVDARLPIVRFIEDSVLEARVGVPIEHARDLRVGSHQTITVDDRTTTAEITAVLPAVDSSTRTVTVVLTVRGREAQPLAPGQLARLAVSETVAEAGYWVPIDALVKHERGLWAVYALESPHDPAATPNPSAKIARRLVEVLHTRADRAFIRGLVSDRERIVAAGAHRIVPGQTVTVANNPADALTARTHSN